MREGISIQGGNPLRGKVVVSGAKNAALPVVVASIVSRGVSQISNVPDLDDIDVLLKILRALGVRADLAKGVLTVDSSGELRSIPPFNLVKMLRASFWLLGPLCARTGIGTVTLPGGDLIGMRPVNLHLEGLARLGAEISFRNGAVVAEAPGGLRGAEINLDFASVGATHHLMTTAALVRGTTIIKNAAREPEVQNLAAFLRSMGADIEGDGGSVIRISGNPDLGGGAATIIGDRIEGATYLCAAAATGGCVEVQGVKKEHYSTLLELLEQTGVNLSVSTGSVEALAADSVIVDGLNGIRRGVSVETAPFPGFATDMQPILMAMLTVAPTPSTVTESVWESRLGHVNEFKRFGARIAVEGRRAHIDGVSELRAASVDARDLRAGAALVILGLVARGTSIIGEIYHIDRGYEGLVNKLRQLGADIRRISSYEESEYILGC